MKFDQGTGDVLVEEINFGEFLEMVDYDARWIYKGSKTRPPCEQFVYWNVLQTVYPIRPEQFKYFQNKMKANEHLIGGIENNRNI